VCVCLRTRKEAHPSLSQNTHTHKKNREKTPSLKKSKTPKMQAVARMNKDQDRHAGWRGW
jgi:hypothetical protein